MSEGGDDWRNPDEDKDSAKARSFAATIAKALADNPIKAATSLALLVGFLFQVIFWSSIGDMPQLKLEDLATVFAASAPIGLMLLIFFVVPFFVPGIAWVSIRSEVIRTLTEAELKMADQDKAIGTAPVEGSPAKPTAGAPPHPKSDPAAPADLVSAISESKPVDSAGKDEQAAVNQEIQDRVLVAWHRLLLGATVGGALTLIFTFFYAFYPDRIPQWIFALVVTSSPTVIVLSVMTYRYGGVKWALGVNLLLLSIMLGFGGSAIALPLATIARMVTHEMAPSHPILQFATLAGDSFLLLACSFALAWHQFTLRQYLAVTGAVLTVSFVIVLIPLNAHVYIAQGVARTLGQGAEPDMALAVTEEECHMIRALTYAEACVERGGTYVAPSLTVLSEQGDVWFVEFHQRVLDKCGKERPASSVYQMHIPHEAIKGTAHVATTAALVIDAARQADDPVPPKVGSNEPQTKAASDNKPVATNKDISADQGCPN